MPSTSRFSWPHPPGTRRIAGRAATGLAGAAALCVLAACGGSSGAPAAAGSSSAGERELQRDAGGRRFL